MDHTHKNAIEYDTHSVGWVEAAKDNAGHIFIEKPAIESLLPDTLEGKNILCVGVGSGEEIELLQKKHPATIAAIDISEKLLQVTKMRYPAVETAVMDMMSLDFPDASFDLIFSSLTFHYAHDWDQLLSECSRVIVPGGLLVFSSHHPVRWSKNPTGNEYTNERGVTLTEHADVFPGDVAVIYYNHPSVASINDALQNAGFAVEVLQSAPTVVPNPRPDLVMKYKSLAAKNKEKPMFLVCRVVKS